MIKLEHGLAGEKPNCKIIMGEHNLDGNAIRDHEGNITIEADFETDVEDGTYVHINMVDGGHFEGHIHNMTFVNSNGEKRG